MYPMQCLFANIKTERNETMIHYNKQDIEYLLQGAAFLGAGGGGALDLGLKMLKQVEDDGYDIGLDLIAVNEIYLKLFLI